MTDQNKRWLDQLEEQWKPFLDEGSPIQNKRVRKATAVVLWNQARYLSGNLNETTS